MSGGAAGSSGNMISFAEIVQGRDASVRVTVDGMIYAVDLVMVVTGLSRDDAGKTLRRLSDETFPSDKLSERTLPGKGNAHTKLVSFQHAIELIMVLPGQVAKEARTQFSNIIKRYMAGDESLKDEIDANAQSGSPLARMARASVQGDGEEERDSKRRRLMEDAQYRSVALGNISTAVDLMGRLNPTWKNDGRLLLQLEDQVKNIVAPPSFTQAITNGDLAPITISDVALELGCRLNHAQLIQAGKLVAKAYRQRHNADPREELRWVDGTRRLIKSYTEADRDLVEAAISQV